MPGDAMARPSSGSSAPCHPPPSRLTSSLLASSSEVQGCAVGLDQVRELVQDELEEVIEVERRPEGDADLRRSAWETLLLPPERLPSDTRSSLGARLGSHRPSSPGRSNHELPRRSTATSYGLR